MVLGKLIFVLLASYLLGSLSFAIIVSKGVYKKDVRQYGSGNAGMTNMLRTFGKKAAILTIVGDVLKGVISVVIARVTFASYQTLDTVSIFADTTVSGEFVFELAMYLAVLGSFLGHLYPIFFKFKGGKGMSVIAGAMITTTPVTLSIALAIFIAIAFGVKIVSLASVTASISYFFITLAYFKITGTFSMLNLISSIVFPLFIVYSHRSNIKRLLNGTEHRFGQKK